MSSFTDLHTHFIYGIDDGARTAEDMYAMLDAANADGVGRLISTPHVTPGMDKFLDEQYQQRLIDARKYCAFKHYPILIYPGAENLVTPFFEQFLSRNTIRTLADTDHVLIEFLPDATYKDILGTVELLLRKGYIPVLAHIERYRALSGENAYRLKKSCPAVEYQVNAHPILDSGALFRGMYIRKWLKDRIIDHVASDSHSIRNRRTRLTEAHDFLFRKYDPDYVDSLFDGF